MNLSGRWYALALIFILSLLSSNIQSKVPTHHVDGKFINDWLLLGPLPSDSLESDFPEIFSGQKDLDPHEGDLFVTAQGDTLFWRQHQSHRSIVDLLAYFGDQQNAIAFAFCKINSSVSGRHRFLIGSDDGAEVWVNGARSYHNPAARALFIDNDVFTADLKAGENSCLIKISQGTGDWGFALRVVHQEDSAPASPAFYLSSNHINNEIWLPNNAWRFQPGDKAEWAESGFNDSTWETVNPELRPGELPLSGWPDVGWFRFHFMIDSSLFNQSIGIWLWQAGTSHIYLDGNLVVTTGNEESDWQGIPKTLHFDNRAKHVLAVRYSNPTLDRFHQAASNAGFSLRLGELDRMTEDTVLHSRIFLSFQMFLTSLSLAIGLLHLILFFFIPGLKQNLYFALFLFAYAATIFFDYEILLAHDISENLFSFRMHCAVLPLWVIFQLRFVYAIFYRHLPVPFWIISIAAIFLAALMVYQPQVYFGYFGIIYIIVVIEINRVIVLAWLKKKEGVWIIAMGFLIFYLFGIIDTLMDRGVILAFSDMANPYALGSIGFFIAMSVYLSRDFARANQKISEQKMGQKLLEAENARQAKELEDARQLQLSMLPGAVPEHPEVEIAVYMKTATEVGGDYYDFILHKDGGLTIVIGDATGHGMPAGTMVSATKSLFHALAGETSPVNFLIKGSAVIRSMGLKKMFMALTIAHYKQGVMRIAAAGMPYPLVRRSNGGGVEKVILKGMPLGGHSNFPYQEKEIRLNPGDTILFLSDGYEELFNPQGETLSPEQVRNIFQESAGSSANEIIEYLKNAGDRWANGRAQEDDITFVVLKMI